MLEAPFRNTWSKKGNGKSHDGAEWQDDDSSLETEAMEAKAIFKNIRIANGNNNNNNSDDDDKN